MRLLLQVIASWTDKSIRLQIPFKHLQLTPLNFYPLRVGFFYYHTKVIGFLPLNDFSRNFG